MLRAVGMKWMDNAVSHLRALTLGARSETVLNDDTKPRSQTNKTTTGIELNPTSVVWIEKSHHKQTNGHRYSHRWPFLFQSFGLVVNRG